MSLWRDFTDPLPAGGVVYKYYCVRALPVRCGDLVPHDRYLPDYRSGSISLVLTAKQPLLVGSGEAGLSTKEKRQVLYFARSGTGDPALPGSSLKGLVRMYVEALSPSCITGDRDSACGQDDYCPACGLFGRMNYRGRLSFSDATVSVGKSIVRFVPRRWPPRAECEDGRRFYYFDHPSQPGGPVEKEPRSVPGQQPLQFDKAQLMPEGSTFRFGIDFVNLLDWELGLLLLSMGITADSYVGFDLKFAGAKNRLMGRVRLALDAGGICYHRQADDIRRRAGLSVAPAIAASPGQLIDAYFSRCRQADAKGAEQGNCFEDSVKQIADKFKRGAPDG